MTTKQFEAIYRAIMFGAYGTCAMLYLIVDVLRKKHDFWVDTIIGYMMLAAILIYALQAHGKALDAHKEAVRESARKRHFKGGEQ